MLLRSITKHVKDQNWFAVALDFVIVIAGILIAFQISNLNEVSKATAREAVILEQLHAEFTDVVEGMKKAKIENGESLTATRDILRAIRDGVKPNDDAAFLKKISKAGSLNLGPEVPATLVELLSSGSLSNLSSTDVRKALIEYHADIGQFQKYADIVLQRISAPDTGFHTAVYVNPNHPDGDLHDKYDWERLQLAREHLQVLYYGKLALSGDFDKLIESSEAVLSEIEETK